MKITNNLNINQIYQSGKNSKTEQSAAEPLNLKKDQVKLSEESKNLQEIALKSNNVLEKIENIKSEDLKKIKDKIKSGYYQTEEVINSVASTMLDDQEFQSLFMQPDVISIVEDYIDVREKDLEKVNSTKQKILNQEYEKDPEVYNKVADQIIDIYT